MNPPLPHGCVICGPLATLLPFLLQFHPCFLSHQHFPRPSFAAGMAQTQKRQDPSAFPSFSYCNCLYHVIKVICLSYLTKAIATSASVTEALAKRLRHETLLTWETGEVFLLIVRLHVCPALGIQSWRCLERTGRWVIHYQMLVPRNWLARNWCTKSWGMSAFLAEIFESGKA